jgi:hypothetical protein
MRKDVASQMVKIPIKLASAPTGGVRHVYVDYWWLVSDDECVYTFGPTGSPQCNASKTVVERLAGDCSNYPGFQEIRQLPYVSFRVNPTDYV